MPTDHRTVEIDGTTYQVGKLAAKQQFHVARRLAPLLTAMAQAGRLPNLTDIAGFAPLAEVLASMKDEDCDYIIDNCLRVCERQQATGWARVVASNGSIMFADIEANTLMRLTVAVVQNSLANFFPTAQAEPSAPQVVAQG